VFSIADIYYVLTFINKFTTSRISRASANGGIFKFFYRLTVEEFISFVVSTFVAHINLI